MKESKDFEKEQDRALSKNKFKGREQSDLLKKSNETIP
jgi:hypothetical protein